jgi:hypothetical protein
MSIIPGCSIRDIFEKTYPEGLPPSLTLHIAHGLVRAQQYLKTQAVLKNGRNTMLSYQPNELPKVTLIDFNGIQPWREYKAVEHTVFMVRRFMRQGRKALEGMERKNTAKRRSKRQSSSTARCKHTRSDPTARLPSSWSLWSASPTLANDLRDEEELVLNAILQQPGITEEAVENAVAEGGMKVHVV